VTNAFGCTDENSMLTLEVNMRDNKNSAEQPGFELASCETPIAQLCENVAPKPPTTVPPPKNDLCTFDPEEGSSRFPYLEVSCPAAGETVAVVLSFQMPIFQSQFSTAVHASFGVAHDGDGTGRFDQTDGIVLALQFSASFEPASWETCSAIPFYDRIPEDDRFYLGETDNFLCRGIVDSTDKLCFGVSYNTYAGISMRWIAVVSNLGGCSENGNLRFDAYVSDIVTVDAPLREQFVPAECLAGIDVHDCANAEPPATMTPPPSEDQICSYNVQAGFLTYPALEVPCPEPGDKSAVALPFRMPRSPNATVVFAEPAVAAAYDNGSGVFDQTEGIGLMVDQSFPDYEPSDWEYCNEIPFFIDEKETSEYTWENYGYIDFFLCYRFYNATSIDKLCSSQQIGSPPGAMVRLIAVVSNLGNCTGSVRLEAFLNDTVVVAPSIRDQVQRAECANGIEPHNCTRTSPTFAPTFQPVGSAPVDSPAVQLMTVAPTDLSSTPTLQRPLQEGSPIALLPVSTCPTMRVRRHFGWQACMPLLLLLCGL